MGKVYPWFVSKTTAKIVQMGRSQVVLLPTGFRLEGESVWIEKHGDGVILKPIPKLKFKSFAEIGQYLADKFPGAEEFPDPRGSSYGA